MAPRGRSRHPDRGGRGELENAAVEQASLMVDQDAVRAGEMHLGEGVFAPQQPMSASFKLVEDRDRLAGRELG